MAAKSILDQTLKKLSSNAFATNDEKFNGQRIKLIERINSLFEEIAIIRKSKPKKKIESVVNDEESRHIVHPRHE